jgi:hypothetical protein
VFVVLVNCLEAYILGRFFGDGWFEKRGIALSTSNRDDAYLLADLILRIYGKRPSVKLRRYRDGHKVWWVRLWSVTVYERFKEILGDVRRKSINAHPPKMISKDSELCFIAGIIDSESWIYEWRNKLRISLEIYNREMAQWIIKTLSKHGFKAYLSICRDGAFRIDLTGRDAENLYVRLKRIHSLIAPTMPRRVPAVNDAG